MGTLMSEPPPSLSPAELQGAVSMTLFLTFLGRWGLKNGEKKIQRVYRMGYISEKQRRTSVDLVGP